MAVPLYQVDAFTDAPFSGNPAAVCLLNEAASPVWMQNVAAEMNLAETAFLYEENGGYNLRWFTPTIEVELCGHATLASAHVLYESGALAKSEMARFQSASGILTVRGNEDYSLTMDFPATPPLEFVAPTNLADVLGFEPVWVGRSRFDVFVEAPDETSVRSLTPDHSAIAELGQRGVIITAIADDGTTYDVVSRFFAPGAGVPEDPVTGSAHCAIAPYWARKLDRDSLVGYQASSRGGLIGLHVIRDRVELTGRAVTVFRGELDT